MTETTKGAQRRVSDERLLAILASEAYGPMAPATAHDVALDLMSERAAHAETRKALEPSRLETRIARHERDEAQKANALLSEELAKTKAALAALVAACDKADHPRATERDVDAYNAARSAAREVSK